MNECKDKLHVLDEKGRFNAEQGWLVCEISWIMMLSLFVDVVCYVASGVHCSLVYRI